MKLRVLIVSNQVRGIDGTGGLGDVATALAKALAVKEDIDVRILMPGYKTVSGTSIENRFDSVIATDIPVSFGDQLRTAYVCQYFLPTLNNDEPRVPCYLLCMDTYDRATDQKAAILMPILKKLCGWDNIQIAILGSTHPQDSKGRQYAAEIRNLSETNKNSLFFFEGFETDLSHLIYAAADLFLMPSVYEPCGLAQMISMRYGTLPLVRFVGGLVDTVTDEQAGSNGNGFGFREPVADSFAMTDILPATELLNATVRRANVLFGNDPQRWRELVRNAMAMDVSWAIPAGQYLKIYQAAIRSRVRSRFLSS